MKVPSTSTAAVFLVDVDQTVGFGYTYNPSLICDYKMYRENQ